MKTAEFGKPCRAPESGRCRICGSTADEIRGQLSDNWADETKTLCTLPNCIAAARAELGIKPDVKSDQ